MRGAGQQSLRPLVDRGDSSNQRLCIVRTSIESTRRRNAHTTNVPCGDAEASIIEAGASLGLD